MHHIHINTLTFLGSNSFCGINYVLKCFCNDQKQIEGGGGDEYVFVSHYPNYIPSCVFYMK